MQIVKVGSALLLLSLAAGIAGASERGSGGPAAMHPLRASAAQPGSELAGGPAAPLVPGLGELTRLAPFPIRELRWRRDDPPPQGRLGLEEKPSGGKKLVHAIWRNLLLPGWGQRYLEAPGRGWVFMSGEAATWGTWGTFKTQEWLRRRSYTEMAEVFAGVAGDHGNEYWKIVGQYRNWLDYNEWLRFQARREYGFGTDDYYAYIAANEIAAGNSWDWNSESRREDYAMKRKASLNAERRATYTLYALLVNRVISLVDVWRLHRLRGDLEQRLEEQGSLGLGAAPTEVGVSWRLGWYRRF